MAKISARKTNITLGGTAVEGFVASSSLEFKNTIADVKALGDGDGQRGLVVDYEYNVSMDGQNDYAAGAIDSLLFAQVGGTGCALGYDPTGAASPGASDPHYDATSVLLETYAITNDVGSESKFSSSFQGNSTPARTVA